MTDNHPRMGPNDAVRYLRLNEQTVRRLAREGRIPPAEEDAVARGAGSPG